MIRLTIIDSRSGFFVSAKKGAKSVVIAGPYAYECDASNAREKIDIAAKGRLDEIFDDLLFEARPAWWPLSEEEESSKKSTGPSGNIGIGLF